jgi:hypothetical protein
VLCIPSPCSSQLWKWKYPANFTQLEFGKETTKWSI